MKNNLRIKYILLLFILKFIFITNSYSEIIKNFQIIGNDRVSNETVIMFSNLKIGQNINSNDLNKSLKDLYSTNYFKNVRILSDNGTIKLFVQENPIIQSVIINGIDKNNIYENIEKVTNKLEKYPFVENKIIDQVKLFKKYFKILWILFC